MIEWPVYRQTHRKIPKHVEHQDTTDIQEKKFCVLQIFLCLQDIIKYFITYNSTLQCNDGLLYIDLHTSACPSVRKIK